MSLTSTRKDVVFLLGQNQYVAASLDSVEDRDESVRCTWQNKGP